MPIYAYQCESCGFAKDVLQKLSDLPLTDCPTCGVAAFKKQLTAAGFQLKGSGWYATDFKGAGANAGKSEKSEAGPTADAGSASSTPTAAVKSDAAGVSAAAGCGSACACH